MQPPNRTAESIAVEAGVLHVQRRLGPGYTLRKVIFVVVGPDGIEQEIALRPLGRIVEEPADQAAPPGVAGPAVGEEGGIRHSPDYRSVRWGEESFTFTPLQAAIVRQLHEALLNGTPDVGGDTLIVNAGSDVEVRRLDHVFRDHPAWKTMIVSVQRGCYRLAEPTPEHT